MRLLIISVVTLSLISILTFPMFAQSTVTNLPSGFVDDVIVAGLDTPTSFSMAADGRIFFTEKAGKIRVSHNGILQSTPFIDLSHEVNTYRDRGMLGVAVHPDFPTSPYVYVAYVYNPPGVVGYDWTGARVSRVMRLEADSENLNRAMTEKSMVLLGKNSTFANIGNPSQPNTWPYACRPTDNPTGSGFVQDCLPSDGTTHTMGTVLFGRDGALYVGNGDGIDFGNENMRAQSIDSLAGKILRIDPLTGHGYPDNPFYDGDPTSNRSKVYALGMRNPFRFTIHPTTGALWLGDVGNHTWEEVSSGGAGANFGWPCYEGFMRAATYSGCQARFSGSVTVTSPVHAYPHRGGRSAVIGGDIYQGTAFPNEYHNAYFFADFSDQAIRYLDMAGRSPLVRTFATNVPGMVQMENDGNGGLYVLYLISGTLARIRYISSTNTPPSAVADADLQSGSEPLTVYFSSARSYDSDGDTIRAIWHFGDGTTSSQENPAHTYDVAGEYTAILTVTDVHGVSRTDRIQITVGNAPPKAQIFNPSANARYRIGDMVYFSGVGRDPEDGKLPVDAMAWKVLIHHNNHVHYDYFHTVGEAGSFKYADHEDNSHLELCLTVTDSDGLSDMSCRSVRARKVTYHFDTMPSGFELVYAGSRHTTPFSVETYVRAERIIGAPGRSISGRVFDSWSDGGEATHSIKMRNGEKRLVARYLKSSPTHVPTVEVGMRPTATPQLSSDPKPTPHPIVVVEEP